MEGPQTKRQRLTIQNVPSIPINDDRSPFLEASNEMIDLIFRTLSIAFKSKMRLELVCKKFQTRIKSRTSWDGQNEVTIGNVTIDEFSDIHVLINGYKFAVQKVCSALSKLLDRITMENFTLNNMSEIPMKIFMGLCHTITEHKHFINLKVIHLFPDFFDCSPMISALAGCGLENVLEIECGDWNNGRFVEFVVYAFYSMLFDCHNLQIFSLKINDISSIWEILLQALANCHYITELYIDSYNEDISTQNVTEFGHYCSLNFPKLRILRYYLCDLPEYEPLEFINTLDEQSRLNIIELSTSLNPEIASHREYFTTICNFFPNLIFMGITCSGDGRFSSETVLQVVGNIFANYGGHEDVYKFKLNVIVENRGDVFSKLARKKWNDNDELVKIQVTNDIWKCLRDNVEIVLEIEDEED